MSETKMIYKKMAAVMSDIKAIGKDQKVQAGPARFNFRGIDDVYNALHAVMAAHQVFNTVELLDYKPLKEVETANGRKQYQAYNLYRYHFWAEDGSRVSSDAIGEALDSGDKASSKAASMGHKYALLQVFMIPTADMQDGDKETHDVFDPGNRQSQDRRRIDAQKERSRQRVILWIRDKGKLDPTKVDLDALISKLDFSKPMLWKGILMAQHPELFPSAGPSPEAEPTEPLHSTAPQSAPS